MYKNASMSFLKQIFESQPIPRDTFIFKHLVEKDVISDVELPENWLDAKRDPTLVIKVKLGRNSTWYEGTANGGLLTFLFDLAVSCAMMGCNASRSAVLAQLSTKFLLPAAQGALLRFETRLTDCKVTKTNATLFTLTSQAFDDSKCVARATAVFYLKPSSKL
jgi:acyl-coenzyme A thioesterase PaaI-like protein